MIDCIFAVTDYIKFKESLLIANSDIVTDLKINLPATIFTCENNKSVVMVRASQQNIDKYQLLSSVEVCGHGVNIKSESDVTWVNRDLYYSIYDITPIIIIDDFGETTHTPSALHCVFS